MFSKSRIMKKAISISLLLCAAYAASAQSAGLAMQFGSNSYYGTARTLGMGNAVTAVGVDLGSANINPAGLAVAGYSQVTVTPGVSICSGKSAYATSVGTTMGDYSRARFEFPNFGLSLRFDTGLKQGLRSFTFGFVSNVANNYLAEDYSTGTDNKTSMAGYYASVANATGMPGDIYNDKERYSTVNSRLYGWNTILAYDNKLINYNPDAPAGSGYFGSNQKVSGSQAYVPGNLRQQSSSSTYGVKRDVIFNFGFNIDNCLYLGVNLGIPSLRYNYQESYMEAAVNPKDFPVRLQDDLSVGDLTYFKSMTYSYFYSSVLTGVYGKFGVLWLPNEWLRLGFAGKTPTGYRISDSYQSDITTTVEDARQCVSGNPSPYGEYTYRYTSPFELNFGVAATFGHTALLSVDYEMTSYGTMFYSDPRNQGSAKRYGATFYDINKTISNFCGLSHFLRVGGEYNVLRFLAVRAGFNLLTSPEKYYINGSGETVTMNEYMAFFEDYEKGLLNLGRKFSNKEVSRSYSIGVGYNSGGTFFADLAARLTSLPNRCYSPYGDYDNTVLSPTVTLSGRKLIDITLTVGFRF